MCLLIPIAACRETTSLITDAPNKTILDELDSVMDDASDILNIYGISVYKNDSLISQRYYNGASSAEKHNVFSVTKSITSLLVGIAIDEGFIESVDQTIDAYIDLSPYENKDLLATITIEHLLTMSAGIVWNSSNLSGEMEGLRTDPDPLGLILSRNIVFTPGSRFNYSDGAAHLVSVILSQATNMTTHEFAIEYLFSPLDIENTIWDTDQLMNNIGGCDLYLSHEDLSKVAILVLGGGEYEGERIVSEDWICQSIGVQTQANSSTEYGYYWWINDSSETTLISARGWGGQLVYLLPDDNLIIIITTANGWVYEQNASIQAAALNDVIINQIIPLMSGYVD